MLTTAINMIELWDKESYEKVINSSETNFAKLSEQVMGNQNNNVS